ncbi:hypothetical protein C2W62_07325 [Candidatus Entotheonella serta]|nr:hypothetical protein C2W62_07325 [Candidatus Entotheonella serta]
MSRIALFYSNLALCETVYSALNQSIDIYLVNTIEGDKLSEHFPLFFDLALIDGTIECTKVINTTQRIKHQFPNVNILVIGREDREELVLRLIEVGVRGYISKDASYGDLLHMIKAVHCGQTLCSPRLAALVFRRIAELSRQQTPVPEKARVQLTPREREVVSLIALGSRNSEIAQHLDISIDTVKRHVSHIFEKLEVRKRREIMQWAFEFSMSEEMR